MAVYSQTLDTLKSQPRSWLITGAAGFIGSHLLEALLNLGQHVTALDDLSTGSRANLDAVKARVPETAWSKFRLIEGSICNPAACREAMRAADYVLHQAAFISVPLSLENPAECHRVNIDGFAQILAAARDTGVKRVVYASSSAVYGDDETMPKTEEKIGAPLSPYAASKRMNELQALAVAREHGPRAIGLRYFNIFGPRQNPEGGYAAVIPKWITTLAQNHPCFINGSGDISRDFCHVKNVVQANLLAATAENTIAPGESFNVAAGRTTTLLELHSLIAASLHKRGLPIPPESPIYHPPRPGDIIHSGADISKIRRELGYEPAVNLENGLADTVDWYLRNSLKKDSF